MAQLDSLILLICLIFSWSDPAISLHVNVNNVANTKNYWYGSHHKTISSRLFADAGKGFGKYNSNKKAFVKSYGEKELSPIKDLIDEESSMREFFVSNEEWRPLFRSLTNDDPSIPATSFITNKNEEKNAFEFHENTSPWRRLKATPSEQTEISILSNFLDAMQKSLIEDIPVNEATKDDENDLHFIEEGRRMLVCTRLHAVQGIETGSIDSFDRLFGMCWSEVIELSDKNEIDTGSLIVSPNIQYDDLRRFVDMNLQRPLKWLGQNNNFEVVALERGGLGVIRIIHKLSDIPTENLNRT
mmetsp:Transcript_42104/g.47577  ORF Transcript_42104/g.47577 Transcript_42104/m.47577 type:complete len:300 (-) Transcript_42104:8-907(-)